MSKKKKSKGIWWLPYVWGLLFVGCWWLTESFLMGAFYFFIIFCVYAAIFMLCASVLSENSRQRSESYEPASIYDQDLDDEEDFADEAESEDDDVDSYVEDGEINWIDDDDDDADSSRYGNNWDHNTNALEDILYGDDSKYPWEQDFMDVDNEDEVYVDNDIDEDEINWTDDLDEYEINWIDDDDDDDDYYNYAYGKEDENWGEIVKKGIYTGIGIGIGNSIVGGNAFGGGN